MAAASRSKSARSGLHVASRTALQKGAYRHSHYVTLSRCMWHRKARDSACRISLQATTTRDGAVARMTTEGAEIMWRCRIERNYDKKHCSTRDTDDDNANLQIPATLSAHRPLSPSSWQTTMREGTQPALPHPDAPPGLEKNRPHRPSTTKASLTSLRGVQRYTGSRTFASQDHCHADDLWHDADNANPWHDAGDTSSWQDSDSQSSDASNENPWATRTDDGWAWFTEEERAELEERTVGTVFSKASRAVNL
ncbi:hypothetical protein OE88DRAFT_1089228 [Heliocybe sulcata]|uniref:Uncharacterized protein n=1 Tax=Heliocybe sulcata TaxID=5364 RepID=A0A5C3MLF8_9AGAM|nr:hypothetical protein OE88DRAFT_1089228 [Heliocybe sulcata]